MSDMIDRQAAIKALGERPMVWVNSDYELGARNQYDADVLALETLPSAQPGWIPVTERLPKPNEYENNVRKYYLVQNEYGDMMVCSWNGRYWEQMYCNTPVKDKVVAWMPLPKMWEGEKDDG